MTGPCPHCGSTITSPGPEADKAPIQQVSAEVEVPAVVVRETVEVPAASPAPEPVRAVVSPPPLPPVQPPVEPPPPPRKEPVAVAPPPPPKAEPIAPPPSQPEAEPVAPAPSPPPEAEPVRPPHVPVEAEVPGPVKVVPPEPPVVREEPSPVREAAPAEPPDAVEASRVEPSPSAEPPAREAVPPPPPARAEMPVAVSAEPPPRREPEPEIPQPAPPPAIPVDVPVAPVTPPEAASPAQPVPVVPAVQPVAEPLPAEPEIAVKPAEPPAAATVAPMPQVKISIGLSDEALDNIRPAAPAPVPASSAPAPAPVAIPAVPPAPEPAPRPKKSEAPEKQRRSILVPLLVLFALMLGGGAAVFYLSGRLGGGGTKAAPVDPGVQAKIRESEYSQTGWQEEARQVLSSFLAADTPAGKAAFSIRGSELLPQMTAFYGEGAIDDSDTPVSGFSVETLPAEDHKRGIFRMVYDQPPQFEMREFFRPLAPLEVQFGVREPDLLLSSLAKASNFSSEPVKVEVFFKRQPDGLKVDWETFVQTKHRTFRTFTELPDPGRSGIFRLFAVEDVPEKGRASQGTKTYRLVDPAHKTDSVRVEVPVDSELGRSLSILNWRGVEGARPVTKTVTLELEWTREASPRLAIKRFICWEFLGIGGQAVDGSAASGGK